MVRPDPGKSNAEKEYRERLRKARTDADAAYDKIYELTDKQIEGVGKLLDLQKKVETDLESQRLKTKEERIKADKEVERAKIAIKEANRKMEVANAVIVRKQQLVVVELNTKQNELESREKQRREKGHTLGKRVQEIDRLKEQHIDLAKVIIDLAKEENALHGTKAYTLATEVIQEYFPNENPIRNWLIQFSKNPGNKSLDDLQKLVGVTDKKLELLLKTDLGFQLWIKIILKVEDEKMISYMGVVDFDKYGYRNFLVISLSPLNDEKDNIFKVEEIQGTSLIISARTPQTIGTNI